MSIRRFVGVVIGIDASRNAVVNVVTDKACRAIAEQKVCAARMVAAESFCAMVSTVVGVVERSRDASHGVIRSLGTTPLGIAVADPGTLSTTVIAFPDGKCVR